MSKLTLEDAISHCLEVAEQNEKKAEYRPRMDSYDEIESRTDCLECAADHRQLAEWLTELKEARKLLKLAVTCLNDGGCTKDCDVCTNLEDCIRKRHDNSFKWRYTDEVKELIND